LSNNDAPHLAPGIHWQPELRYQWLVLQGHYKTPVSTEVSYLGICNISIKYSQKLVDFGFACFMNFEFAFIG
jgi:hypothetical protein